MLPVILGFASALSWGTGDFAGGLASRKVGPYRAVFFAEAIGLAGILIVLPFFPEKLPDLHIILWSAAAGVVGTLGLITFFEAMRRGRLSVAAPLSALLGAIVPIVIGGVREGLPKPSVLIGIFTALLAILLVSREETDDDEEKNEPYLHLALLAGIGFGFYFVLMHQASQTHFWTPLVVARASGMSAIAIFLLIIRGSFSIPTQGWGLLAVNGIFDVGGNAFFILAGQAGRLDVSSVLSSLYSGVTIFLAWLILKEKLTRAQWIGIALALVGIVLMTL